MKDKKVLEYAIVGINALIDKLEKEVRQGNQYLKQIENGEKPKTNKTAYEIQVIIRKKKEEIEKLVNDKDAIKWALTEIE